MKARRPNYTEIGATSRRKADTSARRSPEREKTNFIIRKKNTPRADAAIRVGSSVENREASRSFATASGT